MALLETGVASDVLDLVSRINTRLVTEGWTVTKFDTSDPDVYELYFNRLIDGSTRYFLIRGDKPSDTLYTASATGYDGGLTWSNQPGKSNNATTNFVAAPIKQYKFFGGASYFYVSIQKQTGIYGHSGIGVLQKCGTWVGGEFCYGTQIFLDANGPNFRWDDPYYPLHSYPFDSMSTHPNCTAVRADTGFGGNTWHQFRIDATLKGQGQGRRDSLMERMRTRTGPNQFNGQTVLMPVYCHVRKQVPEPAWLYAGFPPDMRVLNISGLNSEDSIVLGPDTWGTFPVLQKNGATSQPNSSFYGMAYKEN